jgi:sirohydrochlorin ferrochelatase
MSTALVLMAHGSRNAQANEDLLDLAEKIRGLGRYSMVVPSFLELAEPNIKVACQECVAKGAMRIVMLPYFLSAGIHMRRDLAGIRDDLARVYANVEFLLAAPLGRHPLLMEVVLQRADEAAS